ncbi:tyrosine-type recombinase/integrase [Ferdinandcohnia sp. SAFN-114]|uniref:tyrosine-type recombinase/integrase n=1 Tax=Ferdinandcohnia sp. SAFN-114 TaxID=3387275 RepID=UPI003F7D8D39
MEYEYEIIKDIIPINNINKEITKGNIFNIPSLVTNFLNKDFHHEMIDIVDIGEEDDYSKFNDLEMIYLFIHEEKDQDEKKNRTADTKKEYAREILSFYKKMVEDGPMFDFDSAGHDIYSVLKNLRPRNLRKYQDWIKVVHLGKGGKPYSVATIARKTVVLNSFLSFLYKKKYIHRQLHEALKRANVRDSDRPNRDVSLVEAQQIIEHFSVHPILHCLFSVLITTGARVRELCTSRVCDLSYDKGLYWLKVIGKGGKERELLIYPNVMGTIIEFRKRRGLETDLNPMDESPLFTTAKGKAYNFKYLSNYLTKALKKAEIPFIKYSKRRISAHNFRHAYSIISNELGADIYQISKSLGHADIRTTQIYLEKEQSRHNNASHAWKDSSIMQSINKKTE